MAVEEKTENSKRVEGRCTRHKIPAASQSPYNSKCNSGFPPNITVDDLCLYRKRRTVAANTWPRDSLKIEEGDFKSYKSEYKRRFKNFWNAFNKSLKGEKGITKVRPIKLESSLRLEGSHDFQSEYNESFTKRPVEKLTQPSASIQIMDDGVPTSNSAPVPPVTFESYTKRAPLLKRPTNLKLEGDYYHLTEHAEQFIEYLLSKRSELLRTPTTLKLEGDMETKTENRENFIKYDDFERPTLCKQLSNLHLEGDYNILTEKQEKFLPYEVHRRPPLTKKSTNLHLEGDLSLLPEYRSQFIDYKSLERPKLVLPTNNLKNGGIVDNQTKEANSFDRKMHPLIPFLRESDSRSHNFTNLRRTSARDLYSKNDRTGISNYDTSKSASHPDLTYMTQNVDSDVLDGVRDVKAEYKSSYIDFYKNGRVSPSVKMMRQSELGYIKGDSKMDSKPEYRTSYVDFPRRRPRVPKPQSHLSSEGENYYITEKSEKYHPHIRVDRTETCKREPELKLEGRFECQPEYRKAYIDYLIRERRSPAVQRRAFALIENGANSSDLPKDDVSETDTVKAKEVDTLHVPDQSQSNISSTSRESSSYSPSVRSSPKLEAGTSRNRKLSQLEATAFGSRTRRSTTPSPMSRRGRESQLQPTKDHSPRPPKARSPTLSRVSEKETGLTDGNNYRDSVESDAAFVILDEKVPSKRISANNLYKEQKWMPSWKY